MYMVAHIIQILREEKICYVENKLVLPAPIVAGMEE